MPVGTVYAQLFCTLTSFLALISYTKEISRKILLMLCASGELMVEQGFDGTKFHLKVNWWIDFKLVDYIAHSKLKTGYNRKK